MCPAEEAASRVHGHFKRLVRKEGSGGSREPLPFLFCKEKGSTRLAGDPVLFHAEESILPSTPREDVQSRIQKRVDVAELKPGQ